MSPAQALAAPGTVTVIDGLRGPIVEREVPCHAAVEANRPPEVNYGLIMVNDG